MRRGEGHWAFAGFALALLLIGAGLVRERVVGVRPAEVDRPRVVMIGIRGLSWQAVADLIREEKLPELARIARGEAAVGDIVADGYRSDGEVLASIVTGRFSFKHGVRDLAHASLFRDDPDPFRETVWQSMAGHGERVAVFGFPFDPALPGERARTVTTPPPLRASARVVDRIAVDGLDEGIRAGLDACLAADLAAARLARETLQHDPGRHVFVYLEGLHRWQRELGARGTRLHRYYEWIDEILGDLYRGGDGNTTFVLFSERGNPEGAIAYRPRFPRLDRWPPIGFFMAWGHGVRRSAVAPTLAPVDLAPTLLFVSGTPIPNDMDGAVQLALLDEGYYFQQRLAFRP
jgi:hypothetical protein